MGNFKANTGWTMQKLWDAFQNYLQMCNSALELEMCATINKKELRAFYKSFKKPSASDTAIVNKC